MNELWRHLTDIETLAADRLLNSPERHSSNDFYGHANILKQYAGWPRKKYIKGVIEHSFALNPSYIWEQDIRSGLPGLLVFSRERRDFMRASTPLMVEALGPIIEYASPLVNSEEIASLRRELGSVLLAFPIHSTHNVDACYNISTFRTKILRLGRAFDRVVVCLGWKDVQRGMGVIYAGDGIDCVSAGHMFDFDFLPRLKVIISIADMTVSTNFSSHVGYCVHLGKPHAIIDTDIIFVSPTISLHVRDAVCMEEINRQKDTEKYRWMIDPYKIYSTVITEDQKVVVRRCFGQEDIKSKEEIRTILQSFEDAYHASNAPATVFVPTAI